MFLANWKSSKILAFIWSKQVSLTLLPVARAKQSPRWCSRFSSNVVWISGAQVFLFAHQRVASPDITEPNGNILHLSPHRYGNSFIFPCIHAQGGLLCVVGTSGRFFMNHCSKTWTTQRLKPDWFVNLLVHNSIPILRISARFVRLSFNHEMCDQNLYIVDFNRFHLFFFFFGFPVSIFIENEELENI